MKFTILLLLLAPFVCFSQDLPIDSTTQKITFQEVVNVPGVTKSELYSRAKMWFSKTFKNSQAVLQVDDKESGILTGKGNELLSFKYAMTNFEFRFKFTINVFVKDGKYKYQITDMSVDDSAPGGYNLTLEQINSGKTKFEKTKNDKGEYRARFKGYVTNTIDVSSRLAATLKGEMSKKINDF